MELVALKSFVLLGAAWLAVALGRGRSAAVRHVIWCLAFGGLLVLPGLSVVLPAVRVPMKESLLVPEVTFRSAVLGSSAAGKASGESVAAARSGGADWRVWLLRIWAAGAALSLIPMAVGWTAVEQLRRKARVTTMNGVTVLETPAGTMPMSYGVFKPAIFMPADAREWSEERRQIVLTHEAAHVRRRDGATNVMARAAVALYWWNPLAWFGWREFLKEREGAADDAVLSAGTERTKYAGHLVEIARRMQAAGIGSPAVAMATRPQLEGRLKAILETGRDRTELRSGFLAMGLLAAMGMVVPLAAMQWKAGMAPEGRQMVGQDSGAKWVKEGDGARDRHKRDEANEDYAKAMAAGGGAEEMATVWLHRGIADLTFKDYQAAYEAFDKAQALDKSKTSTVLMWKGVGKQNEGDMEGAAQMFQSSLNAGDQRSSEGATVMELCAAVWEKQGKPDEAKAMRERAFNVRKDLLATIPAKPREPGIFRAGGDVKPPHLTWKMEPSYSEEARLAHYAGTVLLRVVIGKNGVPRDIQIVRPLGMGLDQKAVEAVSNWRFEAGVKDGNPVDVLATIEVSFRLL